MTREHLLDQNIQLRLTLREAVAHLTDALALVEVLERDNQLLRLALANQQAQAEQTAQLVAAYLSAMPHELTAPVGLTVKQAAARYGVSRRTVFAWIDQGKLTTTVTPGGAIRVVV